MTPELYDPPVLIVIGMGHGCAANFPADALPMERLFFGPPLLLKPVGTTVRRRAAKIKPLVTVFATPPDHFPIEKIIGTNGEIFSERRCPGNNHAAFEKDANGAANDIFVFPDKHNFSAIVKLI